MPLQPVEQAFAESLIVEGLVPGTKLGLAIKMREANPKKALPTVCLELKLVPAEPAKRLWKIAEAGVKASPPAAFTFSGGAMMGPYELVEPRGGGLAGDHWRAKRPEGMGFLRLIPPGTGIDTDRAQRLIDRANAGVESPDESILRIDDAGEEFNWLYLGTLGFDGRSLATRLARGALPEAEAIVLAKTVARAFTVAHGFGVAHAGLSPLAIVYGSDGTPRLTDFGVGSVFFDGPSTGMAPGLRLGLLLYAAPELIRGGADTGLDVRADLYALGALLLEAVSAPRAGDVRAPETDPWIVKPPVSEGFVTILRRLLALDPEERYPGADALLADLEKVGAGRVPGPLPPAGPPVVVPRPSTAKPQEIVTEELIIGSESGTDVVTESSGTAEALPPDEAPPPPPDEIPPSGEVEGGIVLAPPTIDPDADPPPPPPDDEAPDELEAPDEAAPPKSKKRTAALGKRSSEGRMRQLGVSSGRAATVPAKPSHGVGAFVVSLLAVVGGLVGAMAATRPEGTALARYDLGRAYLAAAKEGDFKKAGDLIAKVREEAKGDAAVLDAARALERDVVRKRLDAFQAAQKSKDAVAALRAVEGGPLECLAVFDRLKRDASQDAKEWQKVGLALLAQGFAREAVTALTTAAEKDPRCGPDKDLAEAAEWLGVFVPAGKHPALTVDRPFYVGTTEVTRAEYARWVDELKKAQTPHANCHAREPKGKSHAPEGWSAEVALATGDRRPATGVDFFDAYAFAKARRARLPSHAELLAAAQGPAARPFPWGTRPFEPGLGNAAATFGQLVAVGSFPAGASPLGALDLVGNAEEWTALESEDATETKVFGTAFDAPAEKLSLDEAPAVAKLEERSAKRGFRCALTLESAKP